MEAGVEHDAGVDVGIEAAVTSSAVSTEEVRDQWHLVDDGKQASTFHGGEVIFRAKNRTVGADNGAVLSQGHGRQAKGA